MEETERDIFGMRYQPLERLNHMKIKAKLDRLDSKHLAPFLRILDVVPIAVMSLERLTELYNVEDPEKKPQLSALLYAAASLIVEATLKQLPPEIKEKLADKLQEKEEVKKCSMTS
ncbi:MAG: hypothetical protein QXH08_06025 [Candidatus Hadarchaeales archaeon]